MIDSDQSSASVNRDDVVAIIVLRIARFETIGNFLSSLDSV